ncbi:DUF2092 domain-containing protein [Bordetella hinzii]|uniref:Periplasmic protein, PF09865 family n=2 Tax=Bordetella hinzii TaxID=103855 RepID=A0ABR4R479_9BORD|nr:DUF2092 domain-containing protein [Bordetella hinzii]KCB25296.1 periplasmic protein, PF09865 family [Bordetella hinzii OH87 BAL007II]KCB44453.1 periplasmic protein, PF09865 family [Bordetella hinzii 5132]QDJ43231.1 hypothetical protein CBR70_19050 [Bordetella hinzii]QDJ47804.1 hypothetical protein CBR71_19310 [Bordetella hinzii]
MSEQVSRFCLAGLLAASALACLPAAAAPPSASTEDAAALAALDRMGRALRGLQDFRVTARSWADVVMDSGQNISVSHETDLLVSRPRGLRATVRGGGAERGMVYDGKTVNFTSRAGQGPAYYSATAAPPDLDGLVSWLATQYGIEPPLADLFYWGRVPQENVESGREIGAERINGDWCHHYAFRQPGVDWEIWLQTGARPLPCRLVLTDTAYPSRPRYVVDYRWDLRPRLPKDAFVFRAPAGAQRLPLQAVTAGEPR